eukprot:357554-Chlamydomonas_euryale.AAC.1
MPCELHCCHWRPAWQHVPCLGHPFYSMILYRGTVLYSSTLDCSAASCEASMICSMQDRSCARKARPEERLGGLWRCRMGIIDASELRDRFVSIFSPSGRKACEALWKEMAMLVPPSRRPQLLDLCPDVSMLALRVCCMCRARGAQEIEAMLNMPSSLECFSSLHPSQDYRTNTLSFKSAL